MKKREIVEKYRDFIFQKQQEGKTLQEICAIFRDEFNISISPQYLSRLLKRIPKPKKSDRLEIFMRHEKIGELHRTKDGYIVLFQKGVTPPIEPGFYRDLPPLFDNLLPEGINKDLLIKKHGLDPKDKFALLRYCVDAFGGLSLAPYRGEKIAPFPYAVKYEDSILRMEQIQMDEDVRQAIRDLYFHNRSQILNRLSQLSGAQAKLTLSFSKNRLYIPNSLQERTNAMMKIVSKEFRDINIIENLFLHFGRIELRLPTARSYVLLEDEIISEPSFAKNRKDHLIALRIDRMEQKVKETVELTTLMGLMSQQKYDVDLEEIFVFLEDKVSNEDLKLLARYIYYSYLIGNGDMHAKNIAFYKEPALQLAPLYDVVNTKIYGIEGDLGMRFKGRQEIEHEALLFFLERYDQKIEEIYNIVRKRLPNFIERTPLDEEVRDRLLGFLGFEA